jgi:hypothetical protein
VTTILAPSTADQLIETLAVYVDEHSLDSGGSHQRTMLLAACIVRLFDVSPGEAIDLARNDPFDERVSAAADAREELLDLARRLRENAEVTR